MEILGPSVVERQKKNGIETGVMLTTVVRTMDKELEGLERIHSLGIVHRDINPEYSLYSLDNSTIKIIDLVSPNLFPVVRPVSTSFQKSAGLSSVSLLDLAPRDDLEPLVYIALFLLRGQLPWKPRPRTEILLRSQEIIRQMKLSWQNFV
ncbi:hypothetical protein IW262DRAFT_1332898 [Armillaria fumosa]|nr:hypothetical protein IW262DRAFT_1332898 [Armillaria fumosa]